MHRLFAATAVMLSTAVAIWLVDAAVLAQMTWQAQRDLQQRRAVATARGSGWDGRSVRQLRDEAMSRGQRLAPVIRAIDLVGANPAADRPALLERGGNELLPLAGLSSTPTVLCNEVGRHVFFDADRYGFRNPDEAWDRRVMVAIIGDSFAQGACVDDHESFGGLLRAAGFTTLVLGYVGNGPIASLATLREYGPPARPEIVVWALFEANDLENDLASESRQPTLRRYVDDTDFSQHLAHRQPEVDRQLTQLIDRGLQNADARPASWLGTVRDLATLRHLRSQLPRQRPVPDLTLLERLLSLAKASTASWNGRLVLFYLPAPARFRDHFPASRKHVLDGYHRAVEQLAVRLEIPFVDAGPALARERREDMVYPFPSHYRPSGYQAASAPLLQWLRNASPAAR